MKKYHELCHVNIEEFMQKDPPIGLVTFVFHKYGKLRNNNETVLCVFHLYENEIYHNWLRENYPTERLGVDIGSKVIFEWYENEKLVRNSCTVCLIECGIWRLIDDSGRFVGNKTEGMRFEPSQFLFSKSSLYDKDNKLICKK